VDAAESWGARASRRDSATTNGRASLPSGNTSKFRRIAGLRTTPDTRENANRRATSVSKSCSSIRNAAVSRLIKPAPALTI